MRSVQNHRRVRGCAEGARRVAPLQQSLLKRSISKGQFVHHRTPGPLGAIESQRLMEAEDAAPSTHAAQASDAAGALVDMNEPEISSPVPLIPAETRPATEETSQTAAPKIADDESPTADQSLLADAYPSEAVLSAQSEQSMQADTSEILVPSPSMVLLHSQRPDPDANSPQAVVQPEQPVSRMQESEPAEVASTAQASSTEAQATISGGSIAAEQLLPAQDAPAASGEQEGDTAPVMHATFVVPTEKWKHMQMVPLATTAAEIKHSLCSNWNIAESALSVKYNKQELQDAQSLASCGIQASLLPFPSCPWLSSKCLSCCTCACMYVPTTCWSQIAGIELSLSLPQNGDHADIELVIHYQMLSTPHAKHKAEPAKTAKLPSVSHLPTSLLLVPLTVGVIWTILTLFS